MTISNALLFIIFLFFFFFHLISSGSVGDRLNQTQVLKDGDELTSRNGIFILGFFNPGRSKNRYLGIWYNFSIDTIVWVANRNDPIQDSSGALKITSIGVLNLVRNQTRSNNSSTLAGDNHDEVIWSTNSTASVGDHPSNKINIMTIDPLVKLLNFGNLVVMDKSKGPNGSFLWRSFDHLSDCFLQGMKLGINLKSNFMWNLTSWKSEDDPSVGNFTLSASQEGANEYFIYNRNTKIYRGGTWNGHYANAAPEMTINSKDFKSIVVFNEAEISERYQTVTDGMISKMRLYPNGKFGREVWTVRDPKWTTYWNARQDECDSYSRCGPNGVCDNQDPQICRCYKGFTPKVSSTWSKRNFANGCVRKERLNCSKGEGFFQVNGVKLPDTTNGYALVDRSISTLEDCRDQCTRNCSCMAYAAILLNDINPRGCIMWTGNLVDTKLFREGEQDLFLRLPQSELPSNQSGKRKNLISLAIGLAAGLTLLMLICWTLFLWQRRKNREMQSGKNVDKYLKDSNLLIFDFATLALATGNFSDENVIGQGGFGVVYKGRMTDDQDVAVKRLFKYASQHGVDTFVNEVTLIAKLQHRNLVRLLGCCMEGDEQILVYEFLRNKSLDSLIFGERSHGLDWRKRVEIITGIARGLLYLHHDSRLKIIHRDLKAANVLLDDAMNPKICDFGTARIFRTDQMEDNTRRVIGTYGYMAPEYAMGGIFSTKSDVFSFGVLMLEIISGKKNKVFNEEDDELNLLEMAWQLWAQGKGLELFNNMLLESSSCPSSEVIRFIQIGLLCVQNHAMDRPLMSTVVLMLSNNDGSSLPKPRRPCFKNHWVKKKGVDSSSFEKKPPTTNNLTITTMEGR